MLAGLVPNNRTPNRYANGGWKKMAIGLSRACEMIMREGPLRWKRNGVVIFEIKTARTLRTRIVEAQKRHPTPPWLYPPTTVQWLGDQIVRDLNKNRCTEIANCE